MGQGGARREAADRVNLSNELDVIPIRPTSNVPLPAMLHDVSRLPGDDPECVSATQRLH